MREAQGALHGRMHAAWFSKKLRFILMILGCGMIGYLVGGAVAQTEWLAGYDPAIEAAFDRGGWWLVAGWGVTGFFLVVGAGLLLSSLYEPWLRISMKLEPDELVAKPRLMLRVSGAGMIAYAVIVAVFLIPGIDRSAGFSIGATAFGITVILFVRGTQVSDELQRAAQNEAIVWSFLIGETLLVGWALLNHFGYIGPLKPLPVVLIVTLTYFVAAMVAAVRRGLDQ